MITRRVLLAAGIALPAAVAAQPARLPPPTPASPPGTGAIPLDDRVAQGWRRDVLIRWGDRVAFDAPPFAPDRPDAEAAASQFGWDARIVGLLVPPPTADGIRRAVLAVAHPTIEPAMALPAGAADAASIAGAMQGASLVNLEWQGQGRAVRWVVVDGGFQSRRFTATTLCRLTGPVVGDAGLRTGAEGAPDSVRGIIAPQGGCLTPWGSLLLAEAAPADPPPGWAMPRLADRGLRARFGWIVEVDWRDPTTLPAKRTAPGRRLHGDVAAARAADGRAILYMSEAMPGGFLFRFVSAAPIATGEDADNSRLLDEGALFVARRAGERGVWVRLPDTNAARLDPHTAAQEVGASPLDVPSGLAVAPDGRLFVALRGDPLAGPERAFGRVLEITPANGATGEGFAVATLFAAPPGARPPGAEALPLAPDTLSLDAQGRLWVGTAQGALQAQSGQADGLFLVPTDGSARGAARRIYGAPRGAAVGGAAFPPQPGGGEPTVLAAVRRPGTERGTSFAAPATRWPAFDAALPPRSTVIALSAG